MPKLLQFLQEKVVFLPVKLADSFVYRFPYEFKEINLETPFEGKINALHFEIKNPKGVILYFHGNSGNLVRWGEIASGFTEYGYDVFVMDYRGYGKSSGPRNEDHLFSDAQFCYAYLMERYGAENIIVYGRSLGGSFAVRTAAQNKPKKLILEATFYNLQDMASRWLPHAATEKISPRMTYLLQSDQHILHVNCPVYHFHGSKDSVVPLKSGKKLFDLLAENKPELEKKFVLIEGGRHDDLDTYELFKTEMNRILSC